VEATTFTGAPARTEAQRHDALRRANEVRAAIADAKRRLRARVLTLEDAFTDPSCGSAKAWTLMVCVPGLGTQKVARIFNHARVSPNKRVAALSDRQRRELVEGAGLRGRYYG
jgi:hypothetical protein